MSEAPQIPRLLAALLGVEPPPPSGPPRSIARPAGAPAPARGANLPDGTRGRTGREVPGGQRQHATRGASGVESVTETPEAAPPARSRAETSTTRPAQSAVRSSVRRTLASPEALRAGVVVAEVLGRPRALRPYGSDATY